jgi:dipeptidyl aminopeptidase/acylaminoacyl peptidase
VVAYSRGDGNAAFYLHRRGAASQPQLLFLEQPAFSNYTMALTHNVVITARDGLRLPAYLTLPPLPGVPQQLPPGVSGVGSEAAAALSAPGGARAADKGGAAGASTRQQQAAQQQLALRLPMVLLVHGGPWKRASWGSSAGVAQWAANRGYAVLNANFRASSGFGKRFSNAGACAGAWVWRRRLACRRLAAAVVVVV